MTLDQAQAWVLIIGALVTAVTGILGVIVSTVNSIRLGRTEKKVDDQAVVSKKIDLATDGALTVAKEALQIEKARSKQLEEFIRSLPGLEVPSETKQTEQKPIPIPPAILRSQLGEIELPPADTVPPEPAPAAPAVVTPPPPPDKP